MQDPLDDPFEKQRLKSLYRYRILDTEADRAFDDLTLLASQLCNTPMALISLIDRDRQWTKSHFGLARGECDRSIAFCSHTVSLKKLFIVEDTLNDPVFTQHPFVIGEPYIRFYAGQPLITPSGQVIGSLCVIDQRPRKLTKPQEKALVAVARMVINQLELRSHNLELKSSTTFHQILISTLSRELRCSFHQIIQDAKAIQQTLQSQPNSHQDHTKLVASLTSTGERAHQSLHEMLAWSRCHLDSDQDDQDPLEVAELFQQATASLQPQAESKSLKVISYFPESIMIGVSLHQLASIFHHSFQKILTLAQPNSTVEVKVTLADLTLEIHLSYYGHKLPQLAQTYLCANNLTDQVKPYSPDLGILIIKDFLGLLNGRSLFENSTPRRWRFLIPSAHVQGGSKRMFSCPP